MICRIRRAKLPLMGNQYFFAVSDGKVDDDKNLHEERKRIFRSFKEPKVIFLSLFFQFF